MSNLQEQITYPDFIELPFFENGIKTMEEDSYDGRFRFEFKLYITNYKDNYNPDPTKCDDDTFDSDIQLLSVIDENGDIIDLTTEERKEIENKLNQLI